jgi:hypothetical protein
MMVGMSARPCTWLLISLLTPGPAAAAAGPHVTRPPAELEQELAREPMQIVSGAISRPKAKGDITLQVVASFSGEPPYRIKLRRAEPGAETFNNRPRYELAAYELQKLLLDPAEFVIPPTVLRMIPVGELRPYAPGARSTFEGSDDVLVVLQYWLQDVMAVADVYDAGRFATDAVYARHIAQLNILTFLMEHGDSNAGNFLISSSDEGASVYSVDNGIAFGSEEGSRGALWRRIRVDRLPADTVGRLRQIRREDLRARLAVLAQWELRDGHYVVVAPGNNLRSQAGVRTRRGVVQLGLTSREIFQVWRRLRHLLRDLNDGDIKTF